MIAHNGQFALMSRVASFASCSNILRPLEDAFHTIDSFRKQIIFLLMRHRSHQFQIAIIFQIPKRKLKISPFPVWRALQNIAMYVIVKAINAHARRSSFEAHSIGYI